MSNDSTTPTVPEASPEHNRPHSGHDAPATPLAPTARRFRFLPRYEELPWLAAAIGAAAFVYLLMGSPQGIWHTWALVTAILGPLIAVLYRASPAWRLEVEVDATRLRVVRKDEARMTVAWTEVVRLVVAPQSHTFFLDAGDSTRSFLCPGPGAPGPYRIANREALYAWVTQHVPTERHVVVDRLEQLLRPANNS